MKAVKELREITGDSQASFAVRIGKSYATVQRYEGIRPPSGDGWVPFVRIAREYHRLDLAKKFKAAIVQDIGPELIKLIQEKGPEDEYSEKEASQKGIVNQRPVRG